MPKFSESHVEEAALEWLAELGWTIVSGKDGSPDGSTPLREANSDTILVDRLETAIKRLNPLIPYEARHDALRKVTTAESPSLVEENRRIHKLILEGVPVEYHGEDGTIRGDRVWLVEFEQPRRNDWLATNQFSVIENGHNRRPDVVLFVNGLSLGVIELKNPGDENATLTGAYNQLQTYKNEIPSLFRANALLVASDGVQARLGSLTANEERFMPWRTTDGREIAPKGSPELGVLIKGVFEHGRFLELLRDFTVFGDTGSGPVKIIAGYHQFHAAKRAIAATLRAMPRSAFSSGGGLREDPLRYRLPSAEDHPPGDKRIGVIWHTQGSGKSLLMAFYAGQLIRHPNLQNPTVVVVTDRNDLDEQLFGTFAMCRDLIRQTPVQADSRLDLREKLNRASGGVIFTTVQKFTPVPGEDEYPELTDRSNVIVIADEAHRSQYGFRAKMDRGSGRVAYGFAKHLRDALPNASFIGFTGTPIEQDDKSTPAVFGDYVDIYDISRAVEDGATVPIYYESRLARIELDEELKVQIDEEIEELTEDEALTEQERLKRKWAAVERLVGAKQRLDMVASDLVEHLEARLSALEGKAMAVAMSRRIAVALYDAIIALRPEWHSDDDKAGAVKVVMTGSASDPPEWQQHIGNKARRDLIAKRAKDADDPLKLVIVRDMWLTGFDAPSMHTMYIDKPMRGHGLMQAIARVNRVFRDKPAGLVVDYIGIGQNLKHALRDYSPSDQERVGIDEREAVRELLRQFDIVRSMFHGFDYGLAITGSPAQRLSIISAAIEFVLQRQHEAAEREETDEAKKQAHRRYQDVVLALSKAFALAAASDAAAEIRDEIGFFQTVRAALAKTSSSTGKSAAERDFAVQQLLDQAVASTEIVDILKAAGLQSPDISILSDEFLAEVQQMPRKNLALEALKKLLNDEIRSRSKTNVVESKRFSERLDDAIARYHTNAINTVEVIQELIGLAKDIKQASERGEEQGLSAEEVAFYDALADNDSAVEVLGNENLRLIAAELLQKLKANVTVDWSHRESARARMRVLVKRILRQHGYPPDLQEAAVQTVLLQAELLSAHWSG
jgi:type I restriction enzyme, R subunit